MAIPPRTRKRVRAIPRAADGSAFQKCDMCGNSVAIVLADMHECQSSQEVKRFKGIRASQTVREERFLDQPRSAFCFFMEEFKITCASVDPIEMDREGFRTWKNMREEERKPYVKKAAHVNFLYDKALRQDEADRFPKPDVEATKTSNWVPDPWEDCSGSGWHTYMKFSDDFLFCCLKKGRRQKSLRSLIRLKKRRQQLLRSLILDVCTNYDEDWDDSVVLGDSLYGAQ